MAHGLAAGPVTPEAGATGSGPGDGAEASHSRGDQSGGLSGLPGVALHPLMVAGTLSGLLRCLERAVTVQPPGTVFSAPFLFC